MSDLHNLTRTLGLERVADIMGVSGRCLESIRSGRAPLTVDDLYELEKAFPSFDLVGTVRRIGSVREAKGFNRKKQAAK